MSKATFVFSSLLLALLFVTTAELRAQEASRPDFTGVYAPVDPFGQYRRATPASAATSDGALPPPRPVLVLD